jgi:hypothetical protein
MQVYTASKDGTIKLWDYQAMTCIKTLPLREIVRGMVSCCSRCAAHAHGAAGRPPLSLLTPPLRRTRMQVFSEDLPVAFLSINWRDGASGRVITYDMDKNKAGRTAMKTHSARPLYGCGYSRGSSTARTFVATHDKHSLFVWRVGPEIGPPLNLHHTKPYTVSAPAG